MAKNHTYSDKAILAEGKAFSELNDNSVVHLYSVKLHDGKKELAYVADGILKEGKNLLTRIRAYHESKDKDGFRKYLGNVVSIVETIGKAKIKKEKNEPVLIAAKTKKPKK